MQNIENIHEEIFTYLKGWSEQSRANEELNPFFYMRSVRDDRFKNGYWFPGNESYICISFWSGGDSHSKTPNIFFEIHEKFGCRINVVSKDSISKYEYFEGMVENLNASQKRKYIAKKGNMWTKQLSNNPSDWIDKLGEFLVNDKQSIDTYLNSNEFIDLEEFSSNFGFISAVEFDTMLSRVLKERDTILSLLLEKRTKNRRRKKSSEAPKLPFALLKINIENFQGIKIAGVDELRSDARWIFITGENGYGKTTLLQAIALGLNEDPDLEKYLDEKTRISIELINDDEKVFIVRTKGNISKTEQSDFGQFVLGYGAARLNVQSKTSENMESRSQNNVLSLFENDTLLKNINYELFASNYSDEKIYAELRELIKTVTAGRISQIKIEERQALFVETLSNGDKLEPLPLSKLAAGFRSIINIVFDIYLRLRNIQPDKSVSDFHGIVLIDEIENHLHPVLQRDLPITLSKVFPKIQFIISTHSPIPLLAAEKNSIIIRVNRAKEEGVTIERLDTEIDFPTLLPNTILTSPIFGFSEIFSESKDNDFFVRVETTYEEVSENDRQARRIERHLDKETANDILRLLRK